MQTLLLYKFVVAFSSITILAKEIVVQDVSEQKYQPTWDDLDKRILPKWYDDAKIGIFIHWGVYSVPSFGSEWFWINWKKNSTAILNFMKNNYPPHTTYQDFAPDFKAEFFDANKWADIFKNSGARYIVLTSKHHEGFTLWPSKRSFSWNSVDVGPKRDLVGELAKAVRATGLKFGLYHSLFEWFNPMYVDDRATNFTQRQFVDLKVWPDIQQLINDYQPSVLWSDGEWEAKDEYWKATELLAWLYNDSPVKNEIVVNDRWGMGSLCRHGGFYTCTDRYNPGVLQPHKWENAMTIDRRSWGYRRNADIADYKTTQELLRDIATTVSCGGNILMNVGPTKEGTISPIFQDRLLAVGKWLSINGEAIYSSSPWQHQNDTFNGKDIWYTCRTSNYNAKNPIAPPDIADVEYVYAIMLRWPRNNVLKLKDVGSLVEYFKKIKVELLGNSEELTWKIKDDGSIRVTLPEKATVTSELAWVFKFTPLKISEEFDDNRVVNEELSE